MWVDVDYQPRCPLPSERPPCFCPTPPLPTFPCHPLSPLEDSNDGRVPDKNHIQRRENTSLIRAEDERHSLRIVGSERCPSNVHVHDPKLTTQPSLRPPQGCRDSPPEPVGPAGEGPRGFATANEDQQRRAAKEAHHAGVQDGRADPCGGRPRLIASRRAVNGSCCWCGRETRRRLF